MGCMGQKKLVERKVLEEERTCVMKRARHSRGSHGEGRLEPCQRKELQGVRSLSPTPTTASDSGEHEVGCFSEEDARPTFWNGPRERFQTVTDFRSYG